MIKAEDLRIGDIVRVSSDNCMIPKGTVCEVVAIDSERACEDKKGLAGLLPVVREEWDFSHGAWCDYIEGVPLTSEILEKNRFEVTHPGECYNKQIGEHKRFLSRYLSIEYIDTEWEVSMNYDTLIDHVTLCSVRYVHELQHILWALGLDAEFKV